MKLDERILEGKRPLTCYDIEEAEKYIGKLCYICDEYDYFHALALIKPTILKGVEDSEVPFKYDSDKQAEFCLPCEWVKNEPKYRPYTLKEFIGDVNLGGPWIRMRPVGTKKECKFLYTGYLETEVREYICLGCFQFDFISLFKNYEICVNGLWQPFGIEESCDEERE